MPAPPAQALFSILRRWRAAGLLHLPVAPFEEEADVQEELERRTARLAEARARCADCTRCPLHKSRARAVYGAGPLGADILFVTGAPSPADEAAGLPLQGEEGALFDRMLARLGLKREAVYVAPLVKCRPPGERHPEASEIATCLPVWLAAQIALVQPRAICTLGSTATSALLGSTDPIARLRGQRFDWRGIPLFPTYHPGYLLKRTSSRKEAWSDMLTLMAHLGKSVEGGPALASPAPES